MGLLKNWADKINDFMLTGGHRRKDDRFDDTGEIDEFDHFEEEEEQDERSAAAFLYDPTDNTPFSVLHGRSSHPKGMGRPYEPSYRTDDRRDDKIRHISTANTPKTYITQPRNIDDCCNIYQKIAGENQLIIVLNEVETDLAQRMVDFFSGVTVAINGTMRHISNKTFIVSPEGWEIESELSIDDLMDTATFIPPLRTGTR